MELLAQWAQGEGDGGGVVKTELKETVWEITGFRMCKSEGDCRIDFLVWLLSFPIAQLQIVAQAHKMEQLSYRTWTKR